jgi:transaldolase
MNALFDLRDAGQSIWYDNIRRGLLESGELARYLCDYAVTGVTSNPTIFERAIVGSTDYDRAIRAHTARGEWEAEGLFFVLALEDIAAAADVLAPLHTSTGGVDGYVSIEVSPTLAHDTAATVAAGRDLFARAGRPNVMVKVPGTPAGLRAVEELIAVGVPVNVTLLFSTDQYAGAAQAYLRGLERRAEQGLPLGVASVASVFVSRWDSAADPLLPGELKARTAIASAEVTYAAYRELLAGTRWATLAKAGARPQRVLWASTGTKDPHLPDTYYVAALAAPDTVDTIPEATLLAFADHGSLQRPGLGADPTAARATLAAVEAAGVDLDALAGELLAQGLASFAASFTRLLQSIEDKVHTLHKGETGASERLGPVRDASLRVPSAPVEPGR